MDYKAILNLMKEMNQTELTKLEIEEDGIRICMEKASNEMLANQQIIPQNISPAVYPVNPMSMMPLQNTILPGQATQVSQVNAANLTIEAATPVSEKLTEDEGAKKIVSPMVGTFYASPSPDKPAFVKVGDKVKKGQTVCIIEAMKLMNEIESEHDGEVVKILVNNEDMVEFGQPMILIK